MTLDLCIEPPLLHKALPGRVSKTDRGDLEGLRHLVRTGFFAPVHICSEASEMVRVLIGTRERRAMGDSGVRAIWMTTVHLVGLELPKKPPTIRGRTTLEGATITNLRVETQLLMC